MTGQKGLFSTSVGRKNLMAITGLFLAFFLIIHLLGNLTLLFGTNEEAMEHFNEYSHLLGSLTIIKLVSYALYAAIITHALDALLIILKNQKAHGDKYVSFDASATSPWYSRNMGVLGSIILIFIVLHMGNFWAKYKLGIGAEGLDQFTYDSGETGVNLYKLVVATFKMEWLVGVYVISMIALGYHLYHGVNAATRSIGVYHKKWMKTMETCGKIFAVVISFGFAIVPVVVYFIR
ncbi:MAG: succinate dehydrogenase cytochrome b subunit [Ichthyobacteriaceae bacterium]|nr:succinate dehydrogenase cytochrome b subunit [Ichthyobacteriaceae bacterium]